MKERVKVEKKEKINFDSHMVSYLISDFLKTKDYQDVLFLKFGF